MTLLSNNNPHHENKPNCIKPVHENIVSPIRILHCVAGLGRGGYETFIMNVYRKIDKSKVQFDFLYSFDGVFNDEIQAMGGKLYKIPFITQKGPFAYANAVSEFFNQHKEYKIVHSHMDKFSGLIMKLAKKANIKVRIAHSHSTKNEGGILYQTIKNYYGSMLNKNCTHCFACSEQAYNWMFKNNQQNKKIVRNAIDLSRFSNKSDSDKSAFTITNIGRFVKAKNHTFLIDIFSQVKKLVPTAQLILAGTGVLQQTIKEKAKSLNIEESVTFLNDCDDIPELLSKTDVFCMPSLFEGLGIALVEAQAAGVPCIASDTIPKEADVSGQTVFISLQKPAEYWAREILKFKGAKRQNNHDKIKSKGYDINQTAQMLQQFYLENG